MSAQTNKLIDDLLEVATMLSRSIDKGLEWHYPARIVSPLIKHHRTVVDAAVALYAPVKDDLSQVVKSPELGTW